MTRPFSTTCVINGTGSLSEGTAAVKHARRRSAGSFGERMHGFARSTMSSMSVVPLVRIAARVPVRPIVRPNPKCALGESRTRRPPASAGALLYRRLGSAWRGSESARLSVAPVLLVAWLCARSMIVVSVRGAPCRVRCRPRRRRVSVSESVRSIDVIGVRTRLRRSTGVQLQGAQPLRRWQARGGEGSS